MGSLCSEIVMQDHDKTEPGAEPQPCEHRWQTNPGNVHCTLCGLSWQEYKDQQRDPLGTIPAADCGETEQQVRAELAEFRNLELMLGMVELLAQHMRRRRSDDHMLLEGACSLQALHRETGR